MLRASSRAPPRLRACVATRARHPPRLARGRSARATTHEDVFVDALVHALGAPALDRDDDEELDAYVARALAGRAVVTSNRHPAPSKFLQTRKPQLFQVERDSLERRRRGMTAFHRAPPTSALGGAFGGGGGGSMIDDVGGLRGCSELTVDILPYCKFIATPKGVHEHRVHLTREQWQIMSDLTAYVGGPPPPPHYLPPPLTAPMGQRPHGVAPGGALPAASYGAPPAAGAPFALGGLADEIDEIEDD